MDHSNLMSVDKVVQYLGFASIPTIKKWVAAGTFPKPKKFGRFSRWLKSDVDQWLIDSQNGVLYK